MESQKTREQLVPPGDQGVITVNCLIPRHKPVKLTEEFWLPLQDIKVEEKLSRTAVCSKKMSVFKCMAYGICPFSSFAFNNLN